MSALIEKLQQWWNETGLLHHLLPTLALLLVGIIVVRIVIAIVNRMLKKSKLEKAAHGLIRSVIRIVLYLLLGLICASALGIDVTGIVALASVVTLALSLALQNSLTNLIGGFTLLYTHPFASGHYVEIAGQSGTVLEIGMAYTKLATPDNKIVSIPNASVVSAEIVNYTITGTRRVDVTVAASYNAPVEKVLAALEEAATVDGILEDPAIATRVTNYGDHAIEYVVRVWCPTDRYWDVHGATTLNIKKIFDREGIEMTYPHLNVHLDKN